MLIAVSSAHYLAEAAGHRSYTNMRSRSFCWYLAAESTKIDVFTRNVSQANGHCDDMRWQRRSVSIRDNLRQWQFIAI